MGMYASNVLKYEICSVEDQIDNSKDIEDIFVAVFTQKKINPTRV